MLPTHVFCSSQYTFCASGNSFNATHTLVHLECIANGWVSIGFGSSMINSDLYVGWKNSTGGYTLSRRKAASYSLPTVSPEQVASLTTDLTVSHSVPNPNLSFTFLIPKTSYDASNTDYIYAYSDVPPTKIDDVNSSFSRHQSEGDFTADFTKSF